MTTLYQALTLDGYAILGAGAMREAMLAHCSNDLHDENDVDWQSFAASWNDLADDAYLAKVGLLRKRRFAVAHFDTHTQAIKMAEHQPHYQSQVYNALQGGIDRWFEPITESVQQSTSLQALLQFACRTFSQLAVDVQNWRIDIHQFRIEASPEHVGLPTPEGIHRDGVDYVMVTLIDRCNIRSGTTSVHAPDGTELAHFTLTRPLDSVLIDDHRLAHGVTPVEADDPSKFAYRDVLVVTLRKN